MEGWFCWNWTHLGGCYLLLSVFWGYISETGSTAHWFSWSFTHKTFTLFVFCLYKWLEAVDFVHSNLKFSSATIFMNANTCKVSYKQIQNAHEWGLLCDLMHLVLSSHEPCIQLMKFRYEAVQQRNGISMKRLWGSVSLVDEMKFRQLC